MWCHECLRAAFLLYALELFFIGSFHVLMWCQECVRAVFLLYASEIFSILKTNLNSYSYTDDWTGFCFAISAGDGNHFKNEIDKGPPQLIISRSCSTMHPQSPH